MATQMQPKVVTIGIATASYQREAPTTVLRLTEKLLQKGAHVNIWTFEEAVTLTNKDQKDHQEPPGLHEVAGKQHTYVGKFVDGIMKAGLHSGALKWVVCILCVQERGVEAHQMNGAIIGTFADFWKFANASDKLIMIPTYR